MKVPRGPAFLLFFLGLVSLWTSKDFLLAQSRWRKAEPLRLPSKSLKALSHHLRALSKTFDEMYFSAGSQKSASRLINALPESHRPNSLQNREYLEARIDVFGLAAFEARDSAIEIYYDRRAKPLRIDFSRVWHNEILVDGYVVAGVFDRDWQTLLREDVHPFLEAQGLQSSWQNKVSFDLIPTAFAFSSCTKGQVEATKNTAALTGDVVTACVNPVGLAVGTGLAAGQGIYEGVKEKSASAGLKKTCENLPIAGPIYRLSQQGLKKGQAH